MTACACDYAFFVDGVPVHCMGEHHGGGSIPVMHRLPRLDLTPATYIETYGPAPVCSICAPGADLAPKLGG